MPAARTRVCPRAAQNTAGSGDCWGAPRRGRARRLAFPARGSPWRPHVRRTQRAAGSAGWTSPSHSCSKPARTLACRVNRARAFLTPVLPITAARRRTRSLSILPTSRKPASGTTGRPARDSWHAWRPLTIRMPRSRCRLGGPAVRRSLSTGRRPCQRRGQTIFPAVSCCSPARILASPAMTRRAIRTRIRQTVATRGTRCAP